MSEIKFQAQPAGQPVEVSPQAEPAQGAQPQDEGQVQFSMDKMNEIISQSIAKALEDNERKQQSQRDKLEVRINKQIEFLQKRGIEITQEVKNDVASEVREEMKAEFDKPQTSSPKAAGQPQEAERQGTNAIEQSVNAEVDKLDTKYGFNINDDEPEAKELDFSSPFKFVNSYEKAMAVKADRLAGEGQTPRTPGATAHMGGGGGTPGDPLAGLTPMEKLERGYKNPPPTRRK